MATQEVAKNAALRQPAAKEKRRIHELFRRGWTACRLGTCFARLLFFDERAGLRELTDLVVSNEFFRAQQIPSELMALGETLQDLQPKSAMEIGTWTGGTLFFLGRLASPRATIISVDLPGGQLDGGGYSSRRAWIYRRMVCREQRLHTLRGDSHSSEMVAAVKVALRGQPLDYLFIDGDHSYEGVKQDFELYAPLVRKGGIIAFHDIAEHSPETGCEVSRFWNQVKSQYRHAEIVAEPGQAWAGIGVLYVD